MGFLIGIYDILIIGRVSNTNRAKKIIYYFFLKKRLTNREHHIILYIESEVQQMKKEIPSYIAKQRNDWGMVKPFTRVVQNKKGKGSYNRKNWKKEME